MHPCLPHLRAAPRPGLDFGGFDSSRILVLRGGILRSAGNFPEILTQRISTGIVLAGRLGLLDDIIMIIIMIITTIMITTIITIIVTIIPSINCMCYHYHYHHYHCSY